MIANLMMYARPELAEAHDRLWALIRTELTCLGINSPPHLSQNAPEFDVWTDPTLVLSQTCGMPYRLWLHDRVTLVGTPDYGLEGCAPGEYRSAFVVRADDPRTALDQFEQARFAFNVPFSQSGYAAPHAHCKTHGFWFQNRLQTGAHALSAQAVAEGDADIAALDGVSWRLMQRYAPFSSNLRVLDVTAPTPGLPLITANAQDGGKMFKAVTRALEQQSEQDRALLGINGLVAIPKERYLAVPIPDCEDYSRMP